MIADMNYRYVAVDTIDCLIDCSIDCPIDSPIDCSSSVFVVDRIDWKNLTDMVLDKVAGSVDRAARGTLVVRTVYNFCLDGSCWKL